MRTARPRSREEWVVRTWPRLLVWSGLALFWAACLCSAVLPEYALFVGPGLMVAGWALMLMNERG